jgi:alpha-glucosidase
MRTTVPTRKEEVKDPVGRTGWPKDKGRDGERTPMHWDTSANAGFSTGAKTWLPVPPSAAQYNAQSEERNPDSILSVFKKVISLRRKLPALRDGDYIAVNRDDQNVLAYLREGTNGADSVLVALNMSPQPRTVDFKLKGFGIQASAARVLLAAPLQADSELKLNDIKLGPFGVLIAALKSE